MTIETNKSNYYITTKSISKCTVIQFTCKINSITCLFMPVKICSLILDQGDYLLRFGMKGQKETKENPVDVEFDFTGVCSKKAFQSES